MGTLKHWRDAVMPHQDIATNQVSEALFAVNLSRAINQKGANEYRDPTLFFERTHLTRTLKGLIRDVLLTLQGQPGTNSVIHLQTNFGGGKTHAELALYHLLHSPDKVTSVPHVAAFLAENGLKVPEQAALAPLPCADFSVGGHMAGGIKIQTLWGEVAYRLGGEPLYQMVQAADEARTAPGVDLLRQLLVAAGPNLILIDEMLHYVEKAAGVMVGSSTLASQTLAFLRELTEAVDEVPHSVLVASLTASRMESLEVMSEEHALFALSQMENIIRRMEDARTPIESSEIFEIVHTRLFSHVNQATAQEVAQAYAVHYKSEPWKDLLPLEARESSYQETVAKAYPFHPSIIKVLYERWGSRAKFQLTRGTLRFLAHLLAHLWQADRHSFAVGSLIHLSDVDLSAEKVRAETIEVTGGQWESVIGTDVAASSHEGLAISQRIDQRERSGVFAQHRLVQGVATSVFMYMHSAEQSKPIPQAEIRLAVARPEIANPDLVQAFSDCQARLHHYYQEEGGLIFKIEPNPNKVLADERSNFDTDDGRARVESIVKEVLGQSSLFKVTYFEFENSDATESGHVPDDNQLQMVVLSPGKTVVKAKLNAQTAATIEDVGNNYAKRHRYNRNLVLFLAADAAEIANAINRAIDWLAADSVHSNTELMARFSKAQQQAIEQKAMDAMRDTKGFVRRAYKTVVLPAVNQRELFELSYVPQGKTVLEQAEEELTKEQRRRLHQEFNPDLLLNRWDSLWPKTTTIITTESLWQKFARQTGSPILTGISVLQEMIKQGVSRRLFGYGVMHDSGSDVLKAASYDKHKVYLGQYDAATLLTVEVSQRTVLMRTDQVYALFPPTTKEEVAMFVNGPRQSVKSVFDIMRMSPAVQGRVDRQSVFQAIYEGVQAGLFGYAESADSLVVTNESGSLTPGDIRFSGLLIGEDAILPISAEELLQLIPAGANLAVKAVFAQAVATFGDERVTEQAFLNALNRCVKEEKFGYASVENGLFQTGTLPISLDGYIGEPEKIAPDARVIRIHGLLEAAPILANVVKTVIALSKQGQTKITLDLRMEIVGEMDEHPVTTAKNELKQRAATLNIEDSGSA